MKTSYTLRLPEELRRKIKEEAERCQMSANQYILYTLTKEIAYKEAAATLKDRIKKVPSSADAVQLLESIVPDIPPMKEDEIITARG